MLDRKCYCLLEESLKGQQGWWTEGVRGLVVAAASSPVCDATGGEGLRLWEGKHKRGREGGAGGGAGHHGCAQGLKVTGFGVKWLPLLSGVEGVGQVDLGHRARRLHLRLGQQIQRLLQDRGVQVGHLHRAAGQGASRQDGAAAGEDGVGGRGESRLSESGSGRPGDGGLQLGRQLAGEAGVGQGDGHHWEVCVQLGGDLADGLVGSQDELKLLFLLQEISDITLQVGLLILELISFL